MPGNRYMYCSVKLLCNAKTLTVFLNWLKSLQPGKWIICTSYLYGSVYTQYILIFSQITAPD